MSRHNQRLFEELGPYMGGEPAGDPVWKKRAAKLARHLEEVGPQTVEEVIVWGRRAQDWHDGITKNVLATAELDTVEFVDGKWQRKVLQADAA